MPRPILPAPAPAPAPAHLSPPTQDGLEFSFTHLELVAAVPASLFCVWYYRRKHWFANNALGLAFRWVLQWRRWRWRHVDVFVRECARAGCEPQSGAA